MTAESDRELAIKTLSEAVGLPPADHDLYSKSVDEVADLIAIVRTEEREAAAKLVERELQHTDLCNIKMTQYRRSCTCGRDFIINELRTGGAG